MTPKTGAGQLLQLEHLFSRGTGMIEEGQSTSLCVREINTKTQSREIGHKYTVYGVFFPEGYPVLLPPPFTDSFTLMWDWGGANGFDVDTGSTHDIPIPNMPSIQTGENTGTVLEAQI